MHCNQVVDAFFIHRRNMRHLQLQQPQQRHVFCLSFDADVPLLGVTWMDNAESTMCVICHDAFHFMKRKHHCRLCGRLVCNACSPARASIRSSQLERTCRLCCSVLQTLEALGDARVQSNVPSASLIVPTPRYTTPEQDFDKLMRVRKHLKTVKPSASAQYYVVSASWLQHWFDYTQRQRAHPGRISNHSLLSFYQGKLHAKRGGDFRVVHELIWCTLHELYGGGPTITTQSNMAWTIHMTDGELAETLVHTNAMRHPKKQSSLSMQCWFLTECNRRSIVGRMSELQDANGANFAKHAVDAFTSASHQARQDAEDRLSHVRLSVYPSRLSRLSKVHATL
ncbi:hypothetical protein AC1031_012766 [Aphanomyces cochlioides]|nr:hypothetical protein AC1031_012766 [Aphanomyces cochlioides]